MSGYLGPGPVGNRYHHPALARSKIGKGGRGDGLLQSAGQETDRIRRPLTPRRGNHLDAKCLIEPGGDLAPSVS